MKNRQKHIRPLNIILASDSYKVTHWSQFPKGHTKSSNYIESRGGKWDTMMVAGLKYLAALLADNPITQDDYDEAEAILTPHLGQAYWNAEGWKAIIDDFGGKLPIEIHAAPEGIVIPTHNVIARIDSIDPNFDLDDARFAWLPGYLEGLCLQTVWYASTVATISFESHKVIKQYLDETSDRGEEKLPFMLIDFGYRGASSTESAATGGTSHLYNSMGTDNLAALGLMRHLFPETQEPGGYSIPAREHSTTTIYGTTLKGDKDAYTNSIKNFGTGLYACVMDSVDYQASLRMVGAELKRDILASGGTFVGRPDSGEPAVVVLQALEQFGEDFGTTINSKGYKVLHPSVAVIQGDGLSEPEDILVILEAMKQAGWAACNVAFGMGGGLLQHCNRDWLRFAEKLSSARINGEWVDVYKATPGKESKRGIQELFYHSESDSYHTQVLGFTDGFSASVFDCIFRLGEDLHDQTLAQVRQNASGALKYAA